MPSWLEPDTVTAVLGANLSEQIDAPALEQVVPGVRVWVESKRSDLVVVDEEAETETFTPGADVVLGASMLVWRIYSRRTTPLGILGATEDGYTGIMRDDPDIARLLGIGNAGRFVFGGFNPCAAVT